MTARCLSERLPNKCLLPFPNAPVITHVLQRARGVGIDVVLCTTLDASDDELVRIATSSGYEAFRGHPTNKIRRWADASSHYRFDAVHLIDADDPYFDICEIRDSLQWLKSEQLDLVRTSHRSDSGMASVGTSTSASFIAELAIRVSALRSDDLDVIPWDLLLRDSDRVEVMPDRYLGSLSTTARLTLDYVEDYEMLLMLAQRFGPNACRFEIERYLANVPAVSEVNLWRSRDFSNRQERQRAEFSGGPN